MIRATHTGTCQWCGRRQMLPGGVLAAHGYEISHGFQNGVCYGTNSLPFEQSKDLIEQAIVSARRQAEETRAKAHTISTLRNSPAAYHQVYHPELSSRTKGSVRLWHEGIVTGETPQFEFKYLRRGVNCKDRLHRMARDANALAQEMRNEYVAALEAMAKRKDEYIEWQRRRIADWMPQPLQPRGK